MATLFEKQRRERERASKKEAKQKEKDENTARKTGNRRKLAAIAQESKSPAAQASAIQHLQGLNAQDKLLELAENGSSPMVRCEAACMLSDRKKAETVAEASIVGAFAGLSQEKAFSWKSWISLVKSDELLLKAYDAAKDNGTLRREMRTEYARSHHDVLRQILTSSILWFPDVSHTLEIFEGTREDWLEIAAKAKHAGAVQAAVRHLTMEDEEALLDMAGKGGIYAARRLVELDPEKYTDIYATQLDEKELEKAIRENRLSQETLEKVALKYPVEGMLQKWIGMDAARAALNNLNDPELLAHLLLNKTIISKLTSNKDYQIFFNNLTLKLRGRPEVLTDYILKYHSGDLYIYPALSGALELITDSGKLYQIAASDCLMAKEAVKRIEPEKMERLVREAKDSYVRGYAQRQWHDARISAADEEELLKNLEWYLENTQSEEPLDQIASRLKTPEAALRAFRLLRKASWGQKTADQLLPLITNAEELTQICLAGPVSQATARRLRELIGGTPMEEKFVAASQEQMCFTQLKDYFNISAEEAILKYGGEKYIRYLVDRLEKEKELGAANSQINHIRWIYNHIPASHEILNTIKGKNYRKHVDEESSCASESCNTNVSFEVRL